MTQTFRWKNRNSFIAETASEIIKSWIRSHRNNDTKIDELENWTLDVEDHIKDALNMNNNDVTEKFIANGIWISDKSYSKVKKEISDRVEIEARRKSKFQKDENLTAYYKRLHEIMATD